MVPVTTRYMANGVDMASSAYFLSFSRSSAPIFIG
jgi:hypothetical protein